MEYKCERSGSTFHKGKLIVFKKGENDLPKGSLDHVGGCEMITKDQVQTTVVNDSEKRSYPVDKGAGWYLLSNGEKIRGEEKAIKKQEELNA